MDDPSAAASAGQAEYAHSHYGGAMKYNVIPSRFTREWVAEAFNPERDGESYIASFSGPEAKARAIEYASWKNSQQQHLTPA